MKVHLKDLQELHDVIIQSTWTRILMDHFQYHVKSRLGGISKVLVLVQCSQ